MAPLNFSQAAALGCHKYIWWFRIEIFFNYSSLFIMAFLHSAWKVVFISVRAANDCIFTQIRIQTKQSNFSSVYKNCSMSTEIYFSRLGCISTVFKYLIPLNLCMHGNCINPLVISLITGHAHTRITKKYFVRDQGKQIYRHTQTRCLILEIWHEILI